MELEETIKNIKIGIILDGEVYEAVKVDYPSCSICAFGKLNYCCSNTLANDLCRTFDKTHKSRESFKCIFKKVNKDNKTE